MRKTIVITCLALLFTGIIALFWYNEWVYSLPTPVPINYRPVNPGEPIPLALNLHSANAKPLFLHFFNPDCPCSRFNVDHFKSLVKQYRNQANFEIVVMSNKNYSTKDIQDKFEVTVPVLFDSAIAVACGVYSTPQAVIIESNGRLFYRGNYNRARYCADPKTEYARMALDSLLHHRLHPLFDLFALKAYGCRLPSCTK
jgi:thioredoxin-related protein